jgi:phospholipid/cholesterol/gamma-HCH transport system substrate-binding protein
MITRRVVRALASSRGVFLTAVLAGSLAGLGFLGTGGGDHVVTARFTDVDGLVAGNEVRVAGVPVGSVNSVAVGVDASGNQYAQVQLTVDSAHWPLHQGTTVAVKPKGVLSNVFVQVDPGAAANPALGDSPYFGINQTSSPINLDALTNVFQPNVRDAIRTQLQEAVIMFGGSGAANGAANLNQSLANLNPLTLDAIPLTDVLATRSPQLDNLNFEFDTITRQLASEDANLRPLIVNLDTTLNALAVKQVDLQGTLTHAASVFGDLNQALSSPTTQADLARIFQLSPEALSCASSLATYLNPIVSAINPYISYKAPYSLDTLLADFVTASGLNTPPNSFVPAPPDALRVDQFVTIPGSGYASHGTGGLTISHNGYVNASTTGGANNVYEEQPPLTGASTHPVLSGCTPPAGLP